MDIYLYDRVSYGGCIIMNTEKTESTSIWPYVTGFVLAVVLTLLAYNAVVNHMWTGASLIAVIISLAIVQLIVQLIFFLHFGRGNDARWNMATFFFMMIILTILVGGTLWIMDNLNYNMMPSGKMDTYMQAKSKSGGF